MEHGTSSAWGQRKRGKFNELIAGDAEKFRFELSKSSTYSQVIELSTFIIENTWQVCVDNFQVYLSIPVDKNESSLLFSISRIICNFHFLFKLKKLLSMI